jgi:hypothetical protein
MGWDPVKAVSPGIAVFNNVPPDVGKDKKQIYADCIMAPRTEGLIEGDGDFVDEACNDEFQSHKRYKMSANSVGPIDMVFNVKNVDQVEPIIERDGSAGPETDQDISRNVYRMIGKLNNHAGQRFSGFRVELGFKLGDQFTPSGPDDGLKIVLNDEVDSRKELTDITMAEFPGGLFYGPADEHHYWGFFSSTRAYFTVNSAALATSTTEDTFSTTTLSENYTDLVGKWLPITWVPTGYFFDDDGNPATDNVVVSWYDGDEWISYDIIPETGVRTAYTPDAATLYMWATTPPTVWDDDGDSPDLGDAQTLGGTLYASWDAENEVYVLADGSGDTLENNEVNKLLEESATLERRTGYMTGPIEDLANLNLNYYIEVADANAGAWPTYDPDNDAYSFTLRITPIADDENLLPAWMVDESTPVVPPVPEEPAPEDPAPDDGDSDSSSSSSGCSIGTGGPLDPTLPLLVLAGLAGLGLRRRMSA